MSQPSCRQDLALPSLEDASPSRFQAFFIGDVSDAASGREPDSRRPSLDAAFDVMAARFANARQGFAAACLKEKPHDLRNLEHDVWEHLDVFVETMQAFREELRSLQAAQSHIKCQLQQSLSSALDAEREQRSSESLALASRLNSAALAERTQHTAAVESLRQALQNAWLAIEEEARIRAANVLNITSTLEEEAQERVALEVSVHKALQDVHADFQEEVARRAELAGEIQQIPEGSQQKSRNLRPPFEDLGQRQSVEEDGCLAGVEGKRMHSTAEDAESIRQEVRKAVEYEHRDRMEDFEVMRRGLTELQTGIDAACQCLQQETTNLYHALELEARERGAADEVLTQRLAEIQGQLETSLSLNRERDEQLKDAPVGIPDAIRQGTADCGGVHAKGMTSTLQNVERESNAPKEDTALSLQEMSHAEGSQKLQPSRVALKPCQDGPKDPNDRRDIRYQLAELQKHLAKSLNCRQWDERLVDEMKESSTSTTG